MAESEEALIPVNNTGAILRQVGLMVGIAASVAIGVAVVLWSQTPNYSLLYGNLSDRDVSQIMEILQGGDIPYKIDHATGAVLVPSSKVYDARMKLASAGIPKSASIGFEMLEKEQGFGTSQFIEQARYQRALEEELARSIGKVNNVRSARVHLALPKQSVFARDRREPSASVLVDLYSGRVLEEGQVGAIAHLVSASVPNLQMGAVTIVDQQGRLLTQSGSSPEMQESARRFDYVKRIEQSYIARIEEILAPVVGRDGVKAQVTADLDFTRTEQTSESYNPDLPALRSEQNLQEQRVGGSEGGIPGALTNQPPGPGTAPETTGAQNPNAAAAGQNGAGAGAGTNTNSQSTPQSSRKQETKNYELDKTISHSRMAVGSVRRLSVAVVVNNKRSVDADGKEVRTEFTPEELTRFTALVKEAVGFDVARGDTVNVINTNFTPALSPEPLPDVPLWERPWVWDVSKQLVGLIFASLVVFTVLRPVMRNLIKKDQPAVAGELSGPGRAALAGGSDATADEESLGGQAEGAAALAQGTAGQPGVPGEPRRIGPPKDNGDIEAVRAYVMQEPKVAAQVVKAWLEADG